MERNPFRFRETEQISLLCLFAPLCFFRCRRPDLHRERGTRHTVKCTANRQG